MVPNPAAREASRPAPAPSARVQRVLARFEMGCPALRDFQVSVQVIGSDPALVLLPAAQKPRGTIELLFTTKGRLRTCLVPHGLTAAQTAAVEDLAWAIYETLSSAGAARVAAR